MILLFPQQPETVYKNKCRWAEKVLALWKYKWCTARKLRVTESYRLKVGRKSRIVLWATKVSSHQRRHILQSSMLLISFRDTFWNLYTALMCKNTLICFSSALRRHCCAHRVKTGHFRYCLFKAPTRKVHSVLIHQTWHGGCWPNICSLALHIEGVSRSVTCLHKHIMEEKD